MVIERVVTRSSGMHVMTGHRDIAQGKDLLIARNPATSAREDQSEKIYGKSSLSRDRQTPTLIKRSCSDSMLGRYRSSTHV
jgi:hypothetical protein